jgi:hypothetical protein
MILRRFSTRAILLQFVNSALKSVFAESGAFCSLQPLYHLNANFCRRAPDRSYWNSSSVGSATLNPRCNPDLKILKEFLNDWPTPREQTVQTYAESDMFPGGIDFFDCITKRFVLGV